MTPVKRRAQHQFRPPHRNPHLRPKPQQRLSPKKVCSTSSIHHHLSDWHPANGPPTTPGTQEAGSKVATATKPVVTGAGAATNGSPRATTAKPPPAAPSSEDSESEDDSDSSSEGESDSDSDSSEDVQTTAQRMAAHRSDVPTIECADVCWLSDSANERAGGRSWRDHATNRCNLFSHGGY